MISAIPTYGRDIQYNYFYLWSFPKSTQNNIWKDVKEKNSTGRKVEESITKHMIPTLAT